MPRWPDRNAVTETQAAREQHVDPDLTEQEAIERRAEHEETSEAAIIDSLRTLGRAGIALEKPEVGFVADQMADHLTDPTPHDPPGRQDLSALLGAILLQHGFTSPESVTTLVESLKDAPTRIIGETATGDPVIGTLSPDEEVARRKEIAAKAQARMAQLGLASQKQAQIVSLLSVPRSQWVQVNTTEKLEFWRNGVRIRIGKGINLVPPYVRDECLATHMKWTEEERNRIEFEKRRVNVTELVYQQYRSGIQDETWTGFAWSPGVRQ